MATEFVSHLRHIAAAAEALANKEERGGCWPGEKEEALREIERALQDAKRCNRDPRC